VQARHHSHAIAAEYLPGRAARLTREHWANHGYSPPSGIVYGMACVVNQVARIMHIDVVRLAIGKQYHPARTITPMRKAAGGVPQHRAQPRAARPN
jgi:hypothetical protein